MARGSTRSTPARTGNSRAKTTSTREPARRSLSPIALIKAVFTHHVRVKRAPKGLTVVLEPEAPAASKAPPKDTKDRKKPRHKDHVALRMHDDLAAVLDAAPGSRRVFRALATVEHHLWYSGSLFLMDLPLPALLRIGEQLEGIAKPPLAAGLKALVERVADAAEQQEKLEREKEMRQPPSSFFVDHKIEVAEASPSIFVEMSGRPLASLKTLARDTETPAHWAS